MITLVVSRLPLQVDRDVQGSQFNPNKVFKLIYDCAEIFSILLIKSDSFATYFIRPSLTAAWRKHIKVYTYLYVM